ARDAVGFGKRADQDGPRLHLRNESDDVCMFGGRIDELVIAFVEDAGDSMAQAEPGDGFEGRGRIDGAGRIVRRVEDDPTGPRGDALLKLRDVDLEAAMRGLDEH